MANTQSSSSHNRLITAVVVAVLVVVLALLSAFLWPGWALNNKAGQTDSYQRTAEEPTKPSIQSKALPDNASVLLKTMPDSVLNFARTEAVPSSTWTTSLPLEEYTLTYSTGDESKNLLLIVGQWDTSDKAKAQYVSLTKAMQGKELAGGNVKVSGNVKGSYLVKAGGKSQAHATAVWQNDTAVFQVSGDKDSIQRFYQKFPL